MSRIQWREKLNWTEDQMDDLRFAGFAYIRQGHYDVAIDFFAALVIIGPENAYDLQTLGALYLQLGEPEKAVKYLENSLKYEADHTPTLLNMTKALFMLERRHEALKLAEILKNEPNREVANTAKALILAYS